ncbi:MAG: type IX secretion system sortase PorU [Bacteroidetes bacterium]|nr:type IX secretion system sortase PorU [Bacteroidota bacterium]
MDGVMPVLSDALVAGKNNSSGTSSQAVNNRKFLLLGDPALTLNYPKYNVVTTEVNNIPIIVAADTLKALEKVTIKGEVRNTAGEILNDFNGIVYPTVYDKPLNVTTLVNDPGKSSLYTFSLQKNAIYKGKASVTNGTFEYTFIVPKDISYLFGNGKLSYYADNGFEDAAGYEQNVIIGGTADSVTTDNTGPKVSVYMNDEKFVFGGLTDENPVLYIKLIDENGINTAGNGIGHDIIALLNDETQGYSLNDYYESELDSYQEGVVNYPLRALEAGRHSITVSAWDVYNNSGEGYTEFVVAENAKLALDHVLNYPNPFTTYTEFWFEHNRPGDILDVKVEIFTVSGKLVKTILQQVNTESYRVDGIGWDGLDNYGDLIGRGVYVYKLSVKAASDNAKAVEFQKLVILR